MKPVFGICPLFPGYVKKNSKSINLYSSLIYNGSVRNLLYILVYKGSFCDQDISEKSGVSFIHEINIW